MDTPATVKLGFASWVTTAIPARPLAGCGRPTRGPVRQQPVPAIQFWKTKSAPLLGAAQKPEAGKPVTHTHGAYLWSLASANPGPLLEYSEARSG